MAKSTGHKPATAPHAEDGEGKQSTVYHWIMTPINFVTFLVSLYLVDYHYQSRREHFHEAGTLQSSRLPGWLHGLVYRPQPYVWVGGGPAPPGQDETRWYYHTKQRKLMKMEASDAFEIRKSVMFALVLFATITVWVLWHVSIALLAWCMRERR
ncbi:hypothetical protein JX265_005384 [Neoarthrinium moseri]|uniref:Uncharacterized protein n=1 Tax=Neoarthrinium moseri TaxID=1658444 RepID=A0A9P9WNJ7_9PEZI|nr:hypothetical protein JX265_005384 [Neoarthrinium moseri]